jgi:hypothetical protein
MVFIESAVFTRQVRELLTDEEYADLQWHLALHPKAGEVIQNTGGLRGCAGSAAAAANEAAYE